MATNVATRAAKPVNSRVIFAIIPFPTLGARGTVSGKSKRPPGRRPLQPPGMRMGNSV